MARHPRAMEEARNPVYRDVASPKDALASRATSEASPSACVVVPRRYAADDGAVTRGASTLSYLQNEDDLRPGTCAC